MSGREKLAWALVAALATWAVAATYSRYELNLLFWEQARVCQFDRSAR